MDIRILLAHEDDEFTALTQEVADLCCYQLRIKCRKATSRAELIKQMECWNPTHIIVDAHLETIDIFEVLDLTRGSDIKVVVTSDEMSCEIENSVCRYGAFGYTPKTCDFDAIEQILRGLAANANEAAALPTELQPVQV